jgi:HK97 family phage portal protein
MSAFTFFETGQGHLGAWGNFFAEIEWGANGNAKALWPLRPDATYPERVNNRIVYRTVIGGQGYVLPRRRVLHIPGLGYDGIVGYNPIYLARQTIGLSAGAEKYGAKFFANNARPGGYLKHPGKLSDEAQKRLVKSWEDRHSGLDNVNRLAVLEEGMEFQTVGVPPQDAQMLQTRKFQVAEIARWYRMPLHKIQELERATYSNIEQQSIEFVTDTMLPWFRRWESAMHTQLLTPKERQRYFAEFLVEGLLRGDTKTRYDAYAVARQWGWLSANDIREKENQNLLPDEQGDIYLVPMNMVPASSVSTKVATEMARNRQIGAEESRAQDDAGPVQRMKLAATFKRLFEDAGTRIVRREKADILRQARKMLERSEENFDYWLEEFYREAPGWMVPIFMPVLLTLADAVQAQAAAEIGALAKMTPELEDWMRGYAEIWASNYAAGSLGQLRDVIKTALEEGGNVLEDIETRLDEWEERRPAKVASKETVEASNVVAKFVFAAAGITYYRWVNTGDDVCPYCQELHGRIVGSDKPFVSKEENLASEDGVMRIRKPAFTPPLHAGCVCQIDYVRR